MLCISNAQIIYSFPPSLSLSQALSLSLPLLLPTLTSISYSLSLCRWVDENFSVHEDFLELIQLPKTDANTVTLALRDSLVRNCLPIGQCRGQAYDGASTFSGHINGVAAQIQRVEPSALPVHCLAHCVNLCLQTAARTCPPIRDVLDLCMGLSQLIRFSPKRLSLFENLQSQLSQAPPSIKPLCPTRWTVRTAAVDAIIKNYSTLCQALEQIHAESRDEYGLKAGGFLASLEKFSTYFGLRLSFLLFAASEQLSLSLQGKDRHISPGDYHRRYSLPELSFRVAINAKI